MTCRLCLTQNISLFNLKDEKYNVIIEKLTDIKVDLSDLKLYAVCCICLSLLKKIIKFRQIVIQANALLSQVTLNQAQFPIVNQCKLYNLCFTNTEHLTILDNDHYYEVKNEEIIVKEHGDVKDEPPCEDNAVSCSSNSEDDVPLKSMCTKKLKRKVKFKKNKGFKEDYAKEVILTREEQLKNLEERKKSANYTKSPYKCEHCYKGFIKHDAYNNHKLKHDQSSGPHECDVCHMRYTSHRQLKTHKAISHDRSYACQRCGLLMHTANQAREHERWHKGYKYVCQLCSKQFCKSTSYLTHMRMRHPMEHVCVICGCSFVGRLGLMMHVSKTHKHQKALLKVGAKSERYCAECEVEFVTVQAWKRHVLTSVKHVTDNETRASCPICGLALTSRAQAKMHIRTHSREINSSPDKVKAVPVKVTCEQCGRSYNHRYKLELHVKRVHLGLKYNKNIVCEICGKKCTSAASLRYHQRTHTGERPYTCETCSKRFTDRNQLRIHTRVHSGEKPYECSQCGKKFSQKPALNRHSRVHTGDKPYLCTYCAKSFSQSNSLKLHINCVHLKLPTNRKKTQTKDNVDKI